MAGYVKRPRDKSLHQGNYRNIRNEKKRRETDTRSPRVTSPLALPVAHLRLLRFFLVVPNFLHRWSRSPDVGTSQEV